MNNEDIIRAAANIIVKAVLDLIEKDPHLFGSRPCSTCETVSNMIGRPFGCVKRRNMKNERRNS